MSVTTLLNILLAVGGSLAVIGFCAAAFWMVRGSATNKIIITAQEPFVEGALYRVVLIGLKAQEAEEQAQNALEAGSTQSQRAALGTLSIAMSGLQEQTRATIEDFRSLVPETVERMVRAGDRPISTPGSQGV
jgi:hypothetical protein